MEHICENLTVTVSVYKNDRPEHFKLAVDSVLNQTLKPRNLIITVDGPIGDNLEKIVKDYEKLPQCIVLRSERNQGLGLAHAQAVSACKTTYLAIMDGDDISLSDRFEKQMNFLKDHPEVDVLGGFIKEFDSETKDFVGIREVKLTDKDIKSQMLKRCPFNHMTTILRCKKILEVGNYMDWHYNEDYFLWIRLQLAGATFSNVKDVLCNVRVDKNMYKRRGGWKYFLSEARLQKFMLKKGMLSFIRYLFNVFLRLILQVIMPNWLRAIVFKKFARTNRENY